MTAVKPNNRRGGWLLAAAAALLSGLLGYAWIHGGRTPVRAISAPVALPGAAR